MCNVHYTHFYFSCGSGRMKRKMSSSNSKVLFISSYRAWLCELDSNNYWTLVQSPGDQHNVIQFERVRHSSCTDAPSIKQLLLSLVGTLSFPGQLVMEPFPGCACGTLIPAIGGRVRVSRARTER